MSATVRQQLDRIALTHLDFETLETRHRDSLDFRDVSAGCVLSALEAAYEAGRQAGINSCPPTTAG